MADKRVFFALLAGFAALLLQPAFADTSIFNGKVVSGSKYVTSTGDDFSVLYVSSEEKLLVGLPGDELIVENKTCSKGKKFEACFSGGSVKGYNYSIPDRTVYEFSLALNLLTPNIAVSKSVSSPSLEVGESAIVSVNVTNSGSVSGPVSFLEKVPDALEIAEIPGQDCQLSFNNSLKFALEISPEARKVCNFRVKALSPGAFTLYSRAEFVSIEKKAVDASAAVSVKELAVNGSASFPGQILLGDSFNVTFRVSSRDKVDWLVFNGFVPGQLKPSLISKNIQSLRNKDGLVVSYGDSFTSLNGSIEIKVAADAAYAGILEISANASWVANGFSQKSSRVFPVNVTLAAPYVRVRIYNSSGDKLSADVVNPAHVSIFNVTLSISGNETANSQEIASMSHLSFEAFPTFRGNVSAAINYQTGYGQKLVAYQKISLNASSLSLPEPLPQASAGPPVAEAKPLAEAPKAAAHEPSPPQPKEPSKPVDLKLAFIFAGIIISAIILFFAIRASRGSEEF